jgi:hypothetical protein
LKRKGVDTSVDWTGAIGKGRNLRSRSDVRGADTGEGEPEASGEGEEEESGEFEVLTIVQNGAEVEFKDESVVHTVAGRNFVSLCS